MKKSILLFLILCLISCEQKVNINKENHLQLFNLKGKVKQITYDYILNEITDISYKPIGKANPRFLDLGSVGDIDLSYTRVFSELDLYYNETFFDSYNIFLRTISSKSFYSNRCDYYEIEFNTDGNVTDFKSYKSGKVIYSINFEYIDNNIVKIKKTEDTKGEYSGIKSEIVIDFEYGKNNLIKKRNERSSNGFSSNSIFTYTFDKEKNEFLISELKNNKFSNGRTEKNNFTYRMTLDSKNNIEEIIYEKDNKNIKFSNGKLKKITEFDKQNSLIFNIELNYNGNSFSEIKKTRFGKLNEIYFEYEDNGNLNNVKCNDESKKEFFNNLKFSYEFDSFKNWTKQTYAIDRSKYDNYIQYLNKRDKYSNEYYEIYGYSPFSNQENFDAEIEKKYLSMYSSKIDVERKIIYY